MGFFDIFRRKKEPEMPEALAKVYKLFFPEGREQQVYLTKIGRASCRERV